MICSIIKYLIPFLTTLSLVDSQYSYILNDVTTITWYMLITNIPTVTDGFIPCDNDTSSDFLNCKPALIYSNELSAIWLISQLFCKFTRIEGCPQVPLRAS
jgi:hypothetical protein